jgi:thiol-disulfide isomerase/thioredoxin
MTIHRTARGRRSRLRRTALVAALLLAGASVLTGCSGGTPAVAGQNYISGDGTVSTLSAADRKDPVKLAGTTLDGGSLDVADLRGQVVVLNVWASWCPPCIAEAKDLEEVHRATDGEGVQFVGINTDADLAAARSHEKRFGVTYPSLDSDGGRLLLALRGTLQPSAKPSTLVLDRHGRVAARVLGKVDASTLTGLITDVLREKA